MNADERFIRQQIRKILHESSPTILVENQFGDFASTSDMYKTFIGPFVNVFKVAKTAFQDVTSATINTIRHSFTFNEDKRKELRRLFKEDRAKYQGRYAEAMKDVDAALASGDAQLLAFMFNPGVYVGAQIFGQAADLGEPVIDVAREKMGMLSKEIDQRLDIGRTADNTAKGPLRGLLGDLKSLFFGEGYQNIGPLLEEKEEGSEEEAPVDGDMSEEEFIEFMTGVLNDSKFGKQLKADAENVIAQKTAEIEAVRTIVKDQMSALNDLVSAHSLEEMSVPFNALKGMGVDLSEQLQQVEQLVEKAKERLHGASEIAPPPDQGETPIKEDDEPTTSKSPTEEAQAVMDELRKTPEGKALPKDAKPEDFEPIIEKGVIAAAFQGGVAEARQELLQGVMDFVAEEMKPSEFADMAKISPMGKKYSALVMNFAKELSEL